MKTIHHFPHPLFQLWSLLEILCADEVVRLPPFLFSVQKALYDSLNSLNSLLVFIIALLLFLTLPPPSLLGKKKGFHILSFYLFFHSQHPPPLPTHIHFYLFVPVFSGALHLFKSPQVSANIFSSHSYLSPPLTFSSTAFPSYQPLSLSLSLTHTVALSFSGDTSLLMTSLQFVF